MRHCLLMGIYFYMVSASSHRILISYKVVLDHYKDFSDNSIIVQRRLFPKNRFSFRNTVNGTRRHSNLRSLSSFTVCTVLVQSNAAYSCKPRYYFDFI